MNKYIISGWYSEEVGGKFTAEVEANSIEEAKDLINKGLAEDIYYSPKYSDHFEWDLVDAEVEVK